MVRLADRRVLSLLRYVIGDKRVIAQLGRIQRWFYIDMQGQTQCLSSISEESLPARLNHEQWALMEQGEMLHRILAMYLGEEIKAQQSELSVYSSVPDYALLLHASIEAQEAAKCWPQRFNHRRDQVVWAALWLLYPKHNKGQALSRLMQITSQSDDPPEPVRYLQTEIQALLTAKST